MPTRVLPKELVSLIHHIELNRAGWDEKAVQRLLLASIWLSGNSATLNEALDLLAKDFHIPLGRSRAKRQLEALCAAGSLVRSHANRYQITDSAIEALEADLADTERVHAEAAARFRDLLRLHCPTLHPEDTWLILNEDFLHPLVQEIGATTYQLINGAADLPKLPGLDVFLRRFHQSLHPPLTTCLRSFLRPGDPSVRSYLLRLLNAHFMVEAISLRKEAIDALAASANPAFDLFFDTNLVFSILQLHTNPANEAARALLALIAHVSPTINIHPFVLPTTLAEARRVLRAAANTLGAVSVGPNLARTALGTGAITGISRSFFMQASSSPVPVDPRDHFARYSDNLIALLATKGISPIDVDLKEFIQDPEVHNDIEDQGQFELHHFPDDAKDYDQLEHDIILWHFVRNRRPFRAESPAHVTSWAVTIDYRLIGFDRYKSEKSGNPVPVCIHPSALIQLLTFWVPRTPEFEEALVTSVQLPFLFQGFDQAAGNVSLRIIQTIARFEDSEDLPPTIVTSMLVNEALRQKMAAEDDASAQADLVRQAIDRETRTKLAGLQLAQSQADALKRDLEARDASISELQQELGATQQALEDERSFRQALDERLANLERITALRDSLESARASRRRYAAYWGLLPGVVVTLLSAGVGSLASRLPAPFSLARGLTVTLSMSFLVWLYLAHRVGSRLEAVSSTRFFRGIQAVRNWAFGVLLVSLITALLKDLIVDAFR